MLNTDFLLRFVDMANDAGLEASYDWEIDGEVLRGVYVKDEFFENEDLDYEIELAKETLSLYANDMAEASAYYYN